MKNRLLLIIFLIISIFLGGCSLNMPHFFQKTAEPVSDLPASAVLTNGPEIKAATLQMIQSAQSAVYIEQDSFQQPDLQQLLIEKARSGVDVKILLDQWQSGNKTVLEELKNENISGQFYPAQKGQYHHVRLLVVDHKQALIYGPSWTEAGFNSPCMAVKLTEKSAWKASSSIFARDWKFTTTLDLDIPKSTSLPEDQITLAYNSNVKQQIIDQLSASASQVSIEVSDLTDVDIIQALLDAVKKRVKVNILLTSRPQSSAQTQVADALKAKGIQVRYASAATSRQFAVFDHKCFIMSSSGWTHSTFVVNHELSLTAPSPEATAKLASLFQQDWSSGTASPPVSAASPS